MVKGYYFYGNKAHYNLPTFAIPTGDQAVEEFNEEFHQKVAMNELGEAKERLTLWTDYQSSPQDVMAAIKAGVRSL